MLKIQLIGTVSDTEKQDLQKRKAVILESLLSGAVLQTENIAEIQDNQLLQTAWKLLRELLLPTSKVIVLRRSLMHR